MSNKLEKILNARNTVRAYSAVPVPQAQVDEPFVPTQDDIDEAEGMALCARHMAQEYGNDPSNEDFHKHLEALDTGTDEQGRSYALALPSPMSKPGYQLVASKKNPKVRRWIRNNAIKNAIEGVKGHIAKGAGIGAGIAIGKLGGGINGAHAGATAAGLAVMSIHNAVRRQTNLKHSHDSALSAMNYLVHHRDFVEKMADKYDLRKEVVAHALAYHAHVEHHRQAHEIATGGHMKNGKPHPLANKDLSDNDYHWNLSGRAKTAFIKGMIEQGRTPHELPN